MGTRNEMIGTSYGDKLAKKKIQQEKFKRQFNVESSGMSGMRQSFDA